MAHHRPLAVEPRKETKNALLRPAFGGVLQGPLAKLMREAALPLGFQLLGGQTVFGGLQTIHRVGVCIVKQPFTNQEVPHHHHGGGHQLAHVGAQS